ncbi:hypothetical protein LEMA_P036940.1 [Plenodomus lingam JN3]|uniref:Uncharacterized protein n=2 Tax=Leptosphaeria maculans TaxID=5022 RepID=E4ZQL5_LEPMJ|nr:hypothetical protein LEMA_P036940.1 [Plenodomus lingam JN3]CBX94020.1 hypothetical protein LEMA_P036940.1 [Plenodomus lingam JN3]
MSLSPTVLHPLTLPGLLDHILTTQTEDNARTLLVVCSSREAFLADLREALQQHDEQEEHRKSTLHDLLTPTLFNLLATQHIQLAFCPSVQSLLAYLTAHGRRSTEARQAAPGTERLVLVNPLALHAPTTSFSAQGLSRTFAAATEAALHAGATLYIVECQGKQRRADDGEDDEDGEAERVGVDEPDDGTEAEPGDPWDQQVSILNLSARRYRSGSSDRAWAGRTVTARRVAARWCHFRNVDVE